MVEVTLHDQEGKNILMMHISLILRERDNLRLNESVVRAQLDTHRLHRQTSHCRAEKEEKRREGNQY